MLALIIVKSEDSDTALSGNATGDTTAIAFSKSNFLLINEVLSVHISSIFIK